MLDPPPYNLTPYPPDDSGDTPEFRAAACDVASKTALNPLAGTYGTCPVHVVDMRMILADMPLTKYKRPPPLQKAVLTDKLVVLERINPKGSTALFKIRVGEQVFLLKMVRCQR